MGEWQAGAPLAAKTLSGAYRLDLVAIYVCSLALTVSACTWRAKTVVFCTVPSVYLNND